jgi:GDP-L-fucose synthase
MEKRPEAPPATPYALETKRVWVAGHRGMVGAALVRRLASERCQVLTADRHTVDLTNQAAVAQWMARERPQAVFVAAAKVGGILANDTYPAEFLYENLMIEANIIHAAHAVGVEKLLFLGSSCIYPKHAPQPIPEEALLTGPLEPTNEWYAIAKIAGIKLAQAYRRQYGCDFISAMPTNLYGPGDNFDLATSHVLPALIRKAHEAKLNGAPELVIWGTGTPRREFLHVEDCADALVFLMQAYSEAEHINVGSGEDLAITDLARLVAEVVGFTGRIVTDPAKPDGTPRKLMAAGKLAALGWRPRLGLAEGIAGTYRWYLETAGAAAVAFSARTRP